MTEQTKIIAAAPAGERARSEGSAPPIPWGPDFAASEHPDTARARIQRDFITSIAGLKREGLDKAYVYLNGLIDAAKEELGHSRSASNPLRRAAMQQHIDELISYVSGHGIAAKLPNRNGEAMGAQLANFFVLEEIPAFLGELKFAIDLWYEKGLGKVHDEMLKLTGLASRLR